MGLTRDKLLEIHMEGYMQEMKRSEEQMLQCLISYALGSVLYFAYVILAPGNGVHNSHEPLPILIMHQGPWVKAGSCRSLTCSCELVSLRMRNLTPAPLGYRGWAEAGCSGTAGSGLSGLSSGWGVQGHLDWLRAPHLCPLQDLHPQKPASGTLQATLMLGKHL